eukprot:COSAG04_NODE_109_length_25931_cov_38.787279_22_plen_78_part_00
MAEETDKMGAAIAEIRAELAQGAVTRSIFAQITESPCNLHQATVHFAARLPVMMLPNGAEFGRRRHEAVPAAASCVA